MALSCPDHNIPQLLKLASDGDAGAWRQLVEAYTPRIYGLMLRQCGDRELAEEMTQQTFVKLVSLLSDHGRYDEQGKFEPWLFRIAMNGLRDEMRRRKRQARPVDFGDTEDGQPDRGRVTLPADPDAPDPLEQVSRAEQVEQLQIAIAQMSEADQQVLHLRHTAGLSFAQIAETLDQPLGTVLARGHRALAKLRKIMTERTTENE